MKTFLLSITLILSTFGTYCHAQKSFIDFGPKVLFGENMLYNSKASFSSDRYLHNPTSLGYGGGLKLAFDFNRSVALVGEGIYYRFNQVYDMTETTVNGGEDVTYKKRISTSVIEIPAMFRVNFPDMDYIEFGYVYSSVLNVSETNTGKGASIDQSIDDHYNGSNSGAVFGFGGYLYGSGNFGISAGLRLRYDFQDFVTYDGQKMDLSTIYAQDSEITGATNPLSLNLVLEFNYDLGFYMANSRCGNNRQVIIGN